jgi:hypothetical protein
MDANFDQRIDRLQERLQAGLQAGVITRAEARPIRQQIRDLTRLEVQYSASGFSDQERRDLQQRIRYIRQNIQVADGRGGRWNRWDEDERYGYGQYGQYGQSGQGGPYQAEMDGWVVANGSCDNGGLGGLFNRVLGGSTCLEVGQRVSGSLYGVPYDSRDLFRDSNSAYFRSDGNRVYQIDPRTNTVVRVFVRERD